MNLYRRRAGKKEEEGDMQYSAPFKYVAAAEFWSIQLKFSDRYIEMKATVQGGRSTCSGENLSSSLVGCTRRKESDGASLEIREEDRQETDALVLLEDGRSNSDMKGKSQSVGAKKL